MFSVRDEIWIAAPRERVFLLSASVAVVRLTLEMQPAGGTGGWLRSGLVVTGDTVAWRGWKFGLPQKHTSVISGYQAPEFFQDTQLAGRFAAFQHDHHFEAVKGGTALRDEVRFALPFGWAGELVAKRVMAPHIAGLLARRFALLKRLSEGEGWREYVPADRNLFYGVETEDADSLRK